MGFRLLLSIGVVICTLTCARIVSASNQTSQLKDIVCVLVMSGLNVEDLDKDMITKLERHNITIHNIDAEKLRQSCVKNKINTETSFKINDTNTEGGKENNNGRTKQINSYYNIATNNSFKKENKNKINHQTFEKNKTIVVERNTEQQNRSPPIRQYDTLFKLLYETEGPNSLTIPNLSNIKRLTFIPENRPQTLNDIVQENNDMKEQNVYDKNVSEHNEYDKYEILKEKSLDNLYHNTTQAQEEGKENITKQEKNIQDKEIQKIVQAVFNNIENMKPNNHKKISKETSILTSTTEKILNNEIITNLFNFSSIIRSNNEQHITSTTPKYNNYQDIFNNNNKKIDQSNKISDKSENVAVTVIPSSIIHEIVNRVQDIIIKKIVTTLPPKTTTEKSIVENKEQENDKSLFRDILHVFKELLKERRLSAVTKQQIINNTEKFTKDNNLKPTINTIKQNYFPNNAINVHNNSAIKLSNPPYIFDKDISEPKETPLMIQTNLYEIPPLLILQPSVNQQDIRNLNIIVTPAFDNNFNIKETRSNQMKHVTNSSHKQNIQVKPKVNRDLTKTYKTRYKNGVSRSKSYSKHLNYQEKSKSSKKGDKRTYENNNHEKKTVKQYVYDNVNVDKINRIFNTFQHNTDHGRHNNIKNNINGIRSKNKNNHFPNKQKNMNYRKPKEQIEDMIKTLDKEIEFTSNINLNERKQTLFRNKKKLRHRTYDDTHFQNFLKSQQKVNEMLDELLTSKPIRNRVSSVEII